MNKYIKLLSLALFISLVLPRPVEAKSYKLGAQISTSSTKPIRNGCTTSNNCTSRQKCVDGYCVDACINKSCAGGCMVEDHEPVCVECTASKHCKDNSDGKKHCDTEHNLCVSCLTDTQCADNEYCEPGSFECKRKECAVANCDICDETIYKCQQCADGYKNDITTCTACNAYGLTVEHGQCSTCTYQGDLRICTEAQCDVGYTWNPVYGRCEQPVCELGYFFKEGEGCSQSCPTNVADITLWELCAEGCCYKYSGSPKYQRDPTVTEYIEYRLVP